MKQNIECKPCSDVWREMIGEYPGEHVQLCTGTMKHDALCDGCGAPLGEGVEAIAVSVCTESSPYIDNWESAHMTVTDVEGAVQ